MSTKQFQSDFYSPIQQQQLVSENKIYHLRTKPNRTDENEQDPRIESWRILAINLIDDTYYFF